LANLNGSPRVAGLEGTQPRKGGDRRCEVDAGAGTAASARRWYATGGRMPSPVRRRANLRVWACAWVRTCVEVSDSSLGPVLAVNRRRGGGHGGAQAGAMGGGEQGNRSSGTNACVWKWRSVARCALADQADDTPFSVTACAKQTPTAKPWRRGRQVCNVKVWRKKKGQRPSLAFQARARACWGARLCEGDVPARTRVGTRMRRRRSHRRPGRRGTRRGTRRRRR
jgi:hypothetical protein